MRVKTFLEDVDATVQHITDHVNLDQRVQWQLFVCSTGLNGTPKVFIEQSFTRGLCHPPTEWKPYKNPCSTDGSFDITELEVVIERKDFKSNWFRARYEPNDNTAGTTTISFTYKTFP